MKPMCVICRKQKARRQCLLRDGAGICPTCCSTARSDACAGCAYYSTSQEYQLDKYRKTGKREFLLEIKPALEDLLNDALELIDKGRRAQAEALLEKADAVDPDYYLLHFARGTIRAKANGLDEAIACFDRTIAKFPYFMEAHFNKAMCCKKKLDIPNAIRSFREVLDTGDPGNENVLWARNFLARMERGIRSTDGIDLDTYLAAYDAFDAGIALMERLEWEKAIRCFEKCTRLNPRSPKGYGNIGLCLGKLGRNKEALAALDKAIEQIGRAHV